jgi:hypothetical protein
LGYDGGNSGNERLHLLMSDLPLFFELDRGLAVFLKKRL